MYRKFFEINKKHYFTVMECRVQNVRRKKEMDRERVFTDDRNNKHAIVLSSICFGRGEIVY